MSRSLITENRGCCYRFWCTGLTTPPTNPSPATLKEIEAGVTDRFLPVIYTPPTVAASLKQKEAAAANEKFIPVVVQDNQKPNDADGHHVMKFFQKVVGPVLMRPWAKAIVFILYAAYLSVAIWGLCQLRSGVSFAKLSNTDSYLANYYYSKDELFNSYGPAVSIVIAEPLEYSDPQTQKKLNSVLETFENHTKYFVADQTHCWLTAYLKFLKYYPRQPRNEEEFIQTLRYQFLKMNGPDVFQLDISFNEDNTKIIGSRFYVQSRWFQKTEDMMLEARRLAETFTDPKITVFHQTFVYFDQPVAVLSNTMQNIGIAVACMFVVSILFVPHPLCALWVTLATASIEAGVLGYMTLWDVNVDFISMTYLILCIGFSVDFSVHITYGFISSMAPTSNKKAIDALGTLGYPILQSGISTVLGIVFLCTSISYLFLSFFKCMLLVILFGTWHALFVLPVTLSVLGGSCRKCEENDCSERVVEKSKHLTEKGMHLCPAIFKDSEKCSVV